VLLQQFIIGSYDPQSATLEEKLTLEVDMKQDALSRLATKTTDGALVERLQADYNLAPVVARTLFEQLRTVFENDYQLSEQTGQLIYLTVSIESPAGRKLEECQRIPVKLSLYTPDDLLALRDGVAILRQQRILRLTEEAYNQGALLSHEDLACLLGSSLATIKRDVARLRSRDLHVPTRGQIKDIGKGVSHKTQIVRDYLDGYTFSDIERRQRHSVASIRRYCQDFARILRLHEKGFDQNEIRRATRLSLRLIQEYLGLFESCPPSNPRLELLLSEPSAATEEPVVIKRGRWLQ